MCIDCDKCGSLGQNDTKPDFILLYENGGQDSPRWFVVEMEGRVYNPNHIVAQLRAGGDAVAGKPMFEVHPGGASVIFVLLYDGHIRTDDIGTIRKGLRKLGRTVIKRCGTSLSSIV